MQTLKRNKHLSSVLDSSQNFLLNAGTRGHLEARYVRRKLEYISAYVSSHYGCNMGCKFCHLTNMPHEHRNLISAKLPEYNSQLNTIIDYTKAIQTIGIPLPNRVNVNFMARGDVFANSVVVNNYEKLHSDFKENIKRLGNDPQLKMNLSSIFPKTIEKRSLVNILGNTPNTYIYYSMYSVRDSFRSYWMPNAIHYDKALQKIKEYQETNGREITFHWAFIEGHNDKMKDVISLAKVIDSYKFTLSKFNLVRFNSPKSIWKEPSEEKLQDLFNVVAQVMVGGKSKIVSRVGQDVAASCGMFISQ